MVTMCKVLFPLIEVMKTLGQAVGLPDRGPPTMRITLHEDNTRALILAKTIPPQFTPRGEFYALKTIWLREQIIKNKVLVVHCPTHLMWADIATKMPPKVTFESLRKLIMGW